MTRSKKLLRHSNEPEQSTAAAVCKVVVPSIHPPLCSSISKLPLFPRMGRSAHGCSLAPCPTTLCLRHIGRELQWRWHSAVEQEAACCILEGGDTVLIVIFLSTEKDISLVSNRLKTLVKCSSNNC